MVRAARGAREQNAALFPPKRMVAQREPGGGGERAGRAGEPSARGSPAWTRAGGPARDAGRATL